MKRWAIALTVVVFALAGGAPAATCTWNSGWDTTPDSADDTVVITGGDLTWGANAESTFTVASWTQGAAYADTVTFNTTYVQGFSITGNATVDGGTWTHKQNDTTQTYRLDVSVGGDFSLASGAAINVGTNDENDADQGGYKGGSGPGNAGSSDPNKPWTQDQGSGAAYGGEGDYGGNTATANPQTYGSILTPEDLGSGNGRPPNNKKYHGGGAVLLNVAGKADIEGDILANGDGKRNNGGGSSGGSIYLTCDELDGGGNISADGGSDGWHGGGGGGRIAIYSGNELDGFGGTVTAYGGTGRSGNRGGAGTIYIDNGDVVVDNPTTGEGTHLPATINPPAEDLSHTDWIIRNYGRVLLTGDAVINSMTIEGPAPAQALPTGVEWLNLGQYELSLYSFTDPDGLPLTTPGTYTDNSSGYFDGVSFNDGSIVVLQPSVVIPEPLTLLAVVAGAGALGGYVRRRRS